MVTFHTNHGDIVIKTFDDKAPETVKNFLDYCREGFYDNMPTSPAWIGLNSSFWRVSVLKIFNIEDSV